MLRNLVIFCCAMLTSCSFSGGDKQSILFASFKDPGKTGIWYALSDDGLYFKPLNGGKPVIPPNDSIAVMRDPFIARDGKGGFHLVWTTGRQKIGYAWSPDLIDWSHQRIIPIDADNDSTTNTWAPELFFNEQNGESLIIYSSTILGQFPETRRQVKNNRNHRIYVVTTKDFQTFSQPELFFDPGYPVIDATIVKEENSFLMVFKDERDFPLRKQLKTATSASLYGPWTNISDPLTASWSEGPSLLKWNEQYFIYYDYYKDPRHMGLMVSDDFINWKDITGQTSFPHRYKHGAFLIITKEERERIIQAFKMG